MIYTCKLHIYALATHTYNVPAVNARHCGASTARYRTCNVKTYGSDEELSNETGRAAPSLCVGDLTFSCKDAAHNLATEAC